MSRMSRGRAASAAKASCYAMPPACAGNAPAGEARDDVPPDSNALDAFFAHAEESELARCSALYGLDLRTEQPLRDSDWDWSYAGDSGTDAALQACTAPVECTPVKPAGLRTCQASTPRSSTPGQGDKRRRCSKEPLSPTAPLCGAVLTH